MGRHVHEDNQSIVVSIHRLFDAVAKQLPTDVISQEREPSEAGESQFVIVTGLMEMGDSFTVAWGRKHG